MHHGMAVPIGREIDHEDGMPGNNSIVNLRLVTHRQNMLNRRLQNNNASGHTGVGWHKKAQKWCASITIHKKFIHLGLFDKIEDAIERRRKAEDEHFGEYGPSRRRTTTT